MTGSRTEPPTPRRQREARRRGQVVRSRELPAAAAFAAGLVAISAWGPWAFSELAAGLRRALADAAAAGSPHALVTGALATFSQVAAPFLLAPALAAGVAALAAGGPALALEALLPRLDRLDPGAGLRRVLSGASLAQVALGLAKGGVLMALLLAWIRANGRSLAQLPRCAVPELWRAAPPGPLATLLAVVALAFGALDLALARRRHRRSLMMTREEVRREAKEDEGDPHHRAERRRLHRDLLEAGPIASATVVVVNPTRVAVALRHRRGGDEAPRVVAKGTGAGAARIRSAARRAGVPIVRDVTLARALLRLAEVGEEIPAELYEAAASVLVHLYASAAPREGAA